MSNTRKFITGLFLTAAALGPGCAPADRNDILTVAAATRPVAATEPADPKRVIAEVNGAPITLGQLEKPLVEAYGLDILMWMTQLDMARQAADEAKVTVTPQDIADERHAMLAKMFHDQDDDEADYESLLTQILEKEHVTATQFDMVVETNACLRKIADPIIRKVMTPEKLQEAFNALYGEKVKVRHIEVATIQQAMEAKHRLEAGEPFEKVAREMSINVRTRAVGGELPQFTRATQGLSAAFKDEAFSLKVGDISDPVQSGANYHIIKLEQRIEPKAVKFEDVKATVADQLYQSMALQTEKELRADIGARMLKVLVIEDPALNQQLKDRIARQQQPPVTDEAAMRRDILRKKAGLSTQPAATMPAPNP